MIALALLAAHLVGDFVFQSRWQADGKFGWTPEALRLRTTHVATYVAAFAPIIYWRLDAGVGFWRVAAFAWILGVLHWLTDSRRFTSTVGDVVGWRFKGSWEGKPSSIPANPWPSLPLAIDQTLHVLQLAALGWLLV
jgi:hypothetical protein